MLSHHVLAIVVNWNGGTALGDCLGSLRSSRSVTLDILVVDNASTDGSHQLVKDRSGERLIRNVSNLGFAEGSNVGLRWARQHRYAFVFLVNNDCRVEPDCLAGLLQFLIGNPQVAAVGPQVLIEGTDRVEAEGIDVRFNHLIARMRNAGGIPNRDKTPRRVDALLGSAMLLRVSALEQVGLLDSRFFLYNEEIDLCYRLTRAGFEVYYFPPVAVAHRGEGNRDPERRKLKFYYLRRNSVLFVRKHGRWVQKLRFVLLSCISLIFASLKALAGHSEQWETVRLKAKGYWDGWRMQNLE